MLLPLYLRPPVASSGVSALKTLAEKLNMTLEEAESFEKCKIDSKIGPVVMAHLASSTSDRKGQSLI